MNNYSFCKFSIPEKTGKVIWEITNECNYSCKYCIFASTGKKPLGELSVEQIKSTLIELKEQNFLYIKFTGGEPFLHPNILEILDFANNLGFSFDISTNASFITDEISLILSKINIKFIHVSLDGFDQSSHELVRGKNSFEPTIIGLKNLLKYNRNIRIGCVLHVGNENNIKDIIKFCEQFKVAELIFSKMEPVGRLHNKNDLLITKSIKSLIDDIDTTPSNIKITHNLQTNLSNIKFIDKNLINIDTNNINNQYCPGLTKFLFIDSLGIVSPCTWISEKYKKYNQFSLSQYSLKTILNQKLFTDFKDLAKTLVNICPAHSNHKLTNNENLKNKFESIYSFSTENLFYLTQIEHNLKTNALTITGSGDQSIVLSMLGYKTITNVDINLYSNYYAELKVEALKTLNYHEFKNFFLINHNSFNYHIYKKISLTLNPIVKKFWDREFLDFNFNGYNIRQSNLFNLNYDNNEEKIINSYYLTNESLYLKAQQSILNTTITYTTSHILDLKLNNKYDIILLSNLADYSHIYFSNDYIENFKEKIILPYFNQLNANGILMFAYIFDYYNINNSHIRNIINLKTTRVNYFSTLKNYKETLIPSSIKNLKNDVICTLENK